MMKIKFGTTTFTNSIQTTIIWFFPREKNTKKKLILLGFSIEANMHCNSCKMTIKVATSKLSSTPCFDKINTTSLVLRPHLKHSMKASKLIRVTPTTLGECF